MKKRYLTVLPLLAAPLLLSTVLSRPSQAEAPAAIPVEELRATNLRRLLVTNACMDCNLVGVDLRDAHLIGADLRGAMLIGADLSGANLEGADLAKADLTGANLTGAFLTNASLMSANLNNANFTEAQLYYVDVRGASVENINLAGAMVVGTPLSIGEGPEMDDQEIPLILEPNDAWTLPPLPPLSEPVPYPGELLDVPEHIIPDT